MMLWKLKTYKTNVGDYASVWENGLGLNPMLTNAVKRRIDMIYTSGKSEIFNDDEFDLSLHRDRQLIGYNYLEYVKLVSITKKSPLVIHSRL